MENPENKKLKKIYQISSIVEGITNRNESPGQGTHKGKT